MDCDPDIEFVYSGESDSPSDSKSPGNPSREAAGAGSMAAELRGSLDLKLRHELFSSSVESKTRRRDRTGRVRIRTRRVQDMRT